MTDDTTARRPAVVAGAIIGVVICVLFAALFAMLAGIDFGTGPVIAVLVLMAGWTIWCAVAYGPGSDDGPDASH